MTEKRLLVYGCSFSASALANNEQLADNSPERSNYACLTSKKLGYKSVVLRGMGGISNQEITNRIILDIHDKVLLATDDVLIQQTSHWRKDIGDRRFDNVTMAKSDVIDYNHPRYSNGEFLREILEDRTMLSWYSANNQYKSWSGDRQISTDPETEKIVRQSLAEWDLILTNMCFLSSALSALNVYSPGSRISVMPFVPLTDASYNKLLTGVDGPGLLQLLYSSWSMMFDSNRFYILPVNPMNFYYNNPNYWDNNNLNNYRKIDHGTTEFHENFANILYLHMKKFYDQPL